MWTVALTYSLVGAVAGLLGGLLGIGGGLVIVPMLVFCFGLQGITDDRAMHLALGTSMASIMFTSASSASAHNRRKSVEWHVVRRMTVGILVGTFLGTCIVAFAPARLLKAFFVVFLCCVATQMVFRREKVQEQPAASVSKSMPGSVRMLGAGGIIGLVSSLVGIGGGTLSVPFMLWNSVPIKSAIGTSAALGFPIAIAGTVGYLYNGMGVAGRPDYAFGYVYLPALAGIAVVSVLTAPLGVGLAHALPVDRLKKVFAILLLVVAARMLVSLL